MNGATWEWGKPGSRCCPCTPWEGGVSGERSEQSWVLFPGCVLTQAKACGHTDGVAGESGRPDSVLRAAIGKGPLCHGFWKVSPRASEVPCPLISQRPREAECLTQDHTAALDGGWQCTGGLNSPSHSLCSCFCASKLPTRGVGKEPGGLPCLEQQDSGSEGSR